MSGPTDDASLKIRAARVAAIRQTPYLASALLRMVLVETDHVPTMAVDRRWRIYVNPQFSASMNVDQLAYVWLHEVSHCLRAHPARWDVVGHHDALHRVFNLAGDALINADLDDIMRTKPADRVTFDKLGLSESHRALSVESLYRILVGARSDAADDSGRDDVDSGDVGESDDAETADERAGGSDTAEPATEASPTHAQRGGGQSWDLDRALDCGSGAAGGLRPWELPETGPGADDGSIDEGAAELIRDTVAQEIRNHGRAIGDVPGGMARWAEARLQPVVDWHRELRAVLSKELSQQTGRRDYTYARPGRRRVPGVVLPAMVACAPPSVAVVIDTSGSMGRDDLERALSETRDLVARVARTRHPLRVLSCDHAAQEAQIVRSIDQVTLVGGGGTDMGTGIRAAADLSPKVDLIVVITDGYTGWPTSPPRPGVRVVAVLTRPDALDCVPAWIKAVDASPNGVSAS